MCRLPSEKFLDRPRRDSTQAFYSHHLNRFLVKVKMLRVSDLKTHNLTDLLDQYKGNYRHNLCRCVKTCFKWLYESEPLCGPVRPRQDSTGHGPR